MKTIFFIRAIFLFSIAGVILAGCKKIDELQKNPNQSDQATPALLLTNILQNTHEDAFEGFDDFPGTQQQFMVCNEVYYMDQTYLWGSGNWGYYNTLRNVNRLEIETNKKSDELTPSYLAIAKFLKAYLFSKISLQAGDIPLSETMKASEGTFYPKYDNQKSVFLQCLNWLEEANSEMGAILSQNGGASIEGDYFFGGSIASWQRIVNSLQLRLLINLSKKESDGDLKIKERFQSIISNPAKYPIVTENDQNLQIVYNESLVSNYYPLYLDLDGSRYTARVLIGATWLDLLTSNKDPRTFIIASPAPSIAADPNNPFANYKGAKTGDLQSYIQTQTVAGQYSTLKRSYWISKTGHPCIQVGASETYFNIAEAINRGWISGDAAANYKNGIRRSMEFFGVSETDVNVFLNQPSIAYKGNGSEGLQQILTQKYVAFFENSGWEAYYNYRRTGIPAWEVGIANENKAIPKRFRYPTDEYTTNAANVKSAVQSQFGGSDTRNDVMWIIE
ncbi:SusD/RagB family nutrient-binding outer membrane lipoprotein [Foetidibacter luteolus]|uniref:SusD/RagB family nutrient-binding outer membrane lipoprotein n=1 Tax=Foetidibacter luteolus TaxID=2608880 RepID=UPI00129C0161|nr:SusD/RagB family nutrient-binding outer membrane lipoprotein [Foetidibacter luteolus]